MSADVSAVVPSVGRPSVVDVVRRLAASPHVAEIIVVLQGYHPGVRGDLLDIPGVRLIEHPDRIGLYAARWDGLQRADYPYVLFLDDDITFSSTTLDLLYETLRTSPCVGVGATIAGNGSSLPRSQFRRVFYRGIFNDLRRHPKPPSPFRSRYASGGFFLGERTAMVASYGQVARLFTGTRFACGEDAFFSGFLSELGDVLLHPSAIVVNEQLGAQNLPLSARCMQRLRRYQTYGETFARSRDDQLHFLLALLPLLPSALGAGRNGMALWLRTLSAAAGHLARSERRSVDGELTR